MPTGQYERKPRGPYKSKNKRPAIFPIGPSICYIPISKDQVALVDWDIGLDIQQYNWCARWDEKGQTFYAQRPPLKGFGETWHMPMHKQILVVDDPLSVDHIDRNTLNNMRYNLRPATQTMQCINQKNLRNNRSGKKGVYFNSRTKKWGACGAFRNVKYHLGWHSTFESACKARDEFESNRII